jgi:hypothetical protein
MSYKVQNQEALKPVRGGGVFVSAPQNDPSALVASRVQKWQAQVKSGNIGSSSSLLTPYET